MATTTRGTEIQSDIPTAVLSASKAKNIGRPGRGNPHKYADTCFIGQLTCRLTGSFGKVEIPRAQNDAMNERGSCCPSVKPLRKLSEGTYKDRRNHGKDKHGLFQGEGNRLVRNFALSLSSGSHTLPCFPASSAHSRADRASQALEAFCFRSIKVLSSTLH